MKFTITFFILLFSFLISFYLRTYLIPQNLFFGPEQGIDFLVIRDIALNHNFTLIGSKTDISGIFHGPVYYYIAVIPFLISQGDPVFVTTFFIFLNALTAIFIYYLGKELKSKRVGIIGSILFTFSYQAIVFARWPSSPPLSLPLVTLFFLFFYRFLKGNKKELLYACICLGLLNQIEFLHIIFYPIISLVLAVYYRNHIKKTNKMFLLFCIFTTIAITTGTYVLFDLRHDLLISKNIIGLALGNTGYHISLSQIAYELWISVTRVFNKTIFPANFFVSQIIFLGSLFIFSIHFIHNKINYLPLLIWFAVPLILLLIFRHNILDHFFVSIIPFFIILTALLIDFIWQKYKYIGVVLIVICLINLVVLYKNIPENQDFFFQSTQPNLRFIDQIATIDSIYENANKKPFSFQSYTIPYFSQQGWEYLFWYRGYKKYGYEPIAQKAKILYVIVQDDPSNKPFQNDWLKNTVSKWGRPTKTFQHGVLTTIKLEIE
jgi:hypothetical protein